MVLDWIVLTTLGLGLERDQLCLYPNTSAGFINVLTRTIVGKRT